MVAVVGALLLLGADVGKARRRRQSARHKEAGKAASGGSGSFALHWATPPPSSQPRGGRLQRDEAAGGVAGDPAEVRVLLSVTTRNRFWTHALSTLSLAQAVRWAEGEGPLDDGGGLSFEWHVIDDASDSKVCEKDAMVQDLLDRGLVQNYTKMPRKSGTVEVLRHVVDVVLARPDIGYWLHSDDDVLMGRRTLRRAVVDYRRDLEPRRWASTGGRGSLGGGVLAIFVNSWLDEQLSMQAPAFGPYAVGPFLGGAAHILNRATLLAIGNPWAQAQRANPRVSPHDAHMMWLRKLLPAQALPIWVRWDEPYECQHLANVQTLNFGRQPAWEPMWAIDHRTKHIVEVEGFPSVDVRAALWAGGSALRDFVTAANAAAPDVAARVKLPRRRTAASASPARDSGQGWSIWSYPRMHAHYIEIGTSDFDTLAERHIQQDDVVGISVEPVRTYFERLPTGGSVNKTLLNVAISDHDGYEDVYLIRPELIDGYRGAASLCQPDAVRQAGLRGCLPGWLRGTSSIKRPPEGARQALAAEAAEMGANGDVGRLLAAALAMARVPCMTFSTLAMVYEVGSVDIVKIDAEGFDHVILKQVVDFAEAYGVWPWQIQFEKNTLSDWLQLDQEVARLVSEFRYTCRKTGEETAACWRPSEARAVAAGASASAARSAGDH